MKKAATLILGLLAICGLIICGSNFGTELWQLLSCVIGLIIFACSMFALIAINNEG